MNRKFKTCKRWMGLCLSVLLVVEASGMQTLAAELSVEGPVIAEAEAVSAGDVSSDVIVENVSAGDASDGDVSDASEGDVSTGDVTDSVSDADVVTTDVMANAIMAATAETIASGTYYGMNWSIDTEGLLTIYGTYTGVWGSNDVKWSTNNAEDILTAKVTATGVTSTKEWFRALPNLQRVDFSEFDASKVTKMYWMFIYCDSLQEVDLSKFATAKVTDLSHMFTDCVSLTKVTFGDFDTSNVTDMTYMFKGCSALESLDLSSFDTSNVKNMSNMFEGCTKLSTLDISSFNTQNVTDMYRMFYYCQALAELDLSHFNTANVTNMSMMFYQCERLERLNLSGFDMAKIATAGRMLDWCNALVELWTPKNLTIDIALDMTLMAEDEELYSTLPKNMAESVHLIRLKAYGDYYGVEWYLTNSGKLTITGTYGKGFGTTCWSDYKDDIVTVVANPSGMTSMKGWFQNHTKLKSVDFTGIDTSAVTDMDKLFYGCTSLESVNLDALDTSQTKYMEQMFLNCKSLKSLDFSKLSTAALLLNDDMLTSCSGLEEVYCFKNLTDATVVTLPVTLVDSTGKKYTTMPVGQTESVLLQKPWAEGTWCGMSWSIAGDGHLAISGTYTATESTDAPWLAYADQITSAKVTATGVTSTKKWFYNLTNLKKVDLSEFDSSKVTDMVSMFNGCKALTKLDLSGFNTAAVTNMSYMFYDCKALTELVLNSNTFNTAKVTNMNRMFYNCAALTAVDVSGFDTAAVTNMDCMFYNCATLTTLDVSNFNTAKVTHMGNMFYYCSALTELDVSGFDTSNVTYMGSMFNTCDSLTELDVSGFDTSKVTDMTRMFFRCRNVKELDVSGFETSLVTKMDYMFEWCGNIEKLDMSKFDMANVVSATNMINGCGKLLNINTPKNLTLDVALPVTMIDDSFAEYTALPKNRATSIAIRVPRTLASGKYYGMDWVLKETGYLTISGTYNKAGEEGTSWRTGYADKIIHVKITATGVTETGRWFSGCTNLKSVDISEFDSSKVNSTLGMFDSCTSLTEIDFSNFNMSKVAEMSMMFRNCTALEKVDLSNVATTRVVLANGCFNGCSSLKTVDLSGFSFVNLSSASNFLTGCNSLVEIRTPKNLNLDVALPVALEEEELGLPCTSLPKKEANSILLKKAAIAVSGTYCGMTWTINEFGGLVISGTFTKAADTDTMWKDYADQVYSVRITAKNVTNTYHWFNNMTKLQVADLSAFDASKVTTMNETFYNCSALTEVNLSNLNTSSVKNMYRMFYNCSALTELDVSGFDTSNVTNMAGMFGLCSGLTTLDVSNFDTSNVTDMSYMFYKCKNLTGIDVSKFNTAKVTTTRQMFYECSKLQNLDVSGFKTSLVTDMYAMFYMCSALTTLDVSGFDTAKVTNTNRMFWCCGKVTALDLSNFDMAAVTDADVMLYGCSALKQIKTPVNLALGVDLPAVYGNGSGVAYKTLPKNTTESVLLKKAIGAGTYCGMDWIVEEGGNLTIYGAFGASADTDTMWKSYANQVIGVKITATGVTNTYHWFNNMTKMQTVDLSEFDSSKVTTMNEMFYNCSALQEVDASNLNTASVKNTYRMFYNCKALTKLDLSGCDFAAVTDATEMLTGCTSLSYINTPKNLNIDVALPGELEDKERNIYTQLPKNLEESIVLTHVIYRIAPIEDQIYTGKAIKPEVVVYKGNRILTEGVDYTVSYKNNTNAATKDAKKAPTVTVKGKTNYMGTLTATFTIQPKTIDSSNVTTTPTIVAKNGKVQSFKSTVTVDGKKLKLKKDYVIVSTDTSEGAYKEPGKYSVDIQGMKNYTGTVQGTLIILDKEQVQAAKLKIGKIPTYTYVEGEPAMPTPSVSYKGKVLVKDVDYEIIYGDNDKAGKASLTIRGLENVAEDGTYVVGTVTKTFTIKGTAISKAKANYTKTVYYTGQEICPEVDLTMGETTLREGTDYSVSYTKNIKVGTGTITIKGQGGYTGTVKKTFKIVTDPTVADKLTVAFVGGEAVAYYRVKGAKPEVLVKLDGTVLELGKDYTVSYKNNKKIPAANVTEKKAPAVVIKGKGNYKFTKTVYFNIAACPVEELTVTAADKFLGDKKGYLSAPVVKDGTKKLKKGKDYEIVGYKTADGAEFSGKEEVANDTYVTVTVRGMGNYTGEESVTYRIATKSISKVKITAKSLAYNEGKPVVYIGQDIKDGLLVLKDNKTKETLQYGKDYKITGYTNNTKTGTATMTIVGCGEYGGTRTVKFKIVKYKLK